MSEHWLIAVFLAIAVVLVLVQPILIRHPLARSIAQLVRQSPVVQARYRGAEQRTTTQVTEAETQLKVDAAPRSVDGPIEMPAAALPPAPSSRSATTKGATSRERLVRGAAILFLALALSYNALHTVADSLLAAGIIALVGFATLELAFYLVPARSTPLAEKPYQSHSAASRRAGMTAIGLAIALALVTTIHLYITPVIDLSLPLYVVAALIGWSGEIWLRGSTINTRLRRVAVAARAHRSELLGVELLTLCGLAVRIWIATRYALLHGTLNDELAVGYLAWQLAHGTTAWPLYVVEHGAAAFYQPIALGFALFGGSMHTLRMTTAIENAALIPAFYVLARQFTNAPVALCGTALLAVAYWPATLGIMAFGMMLGAIFQSLGLALLLYGLRRDSFVATATGGGVLAICFYCYLGARVMPLAALPILLYFLVRGSGSVQHRLMLGATFLLGFATLLVPWVSTVQSNSDLLLGDAPGVGYQFRTAWHTHPSEAFGRVWDHLSSLVLTILATPRAPTYFPLQNGGMLDSLSAAFFLLASGYVIARWWKLQNLLILIALVAPLVAASLVDDGFLKSVSPG